MPNWVKCPEDWELYEKDAEEVFQFWSQGWEDRLDSELANIYA